MRFLIIQQKKNTIITKTSIEINKIDQSNFDAIERENEISTKTLKPDDLITSQDFSIVDEALPRQDLKAGLKDFVHIPPIHIHIRNRISKDSRRKG
ncbi:unnamed protein product [Parnassius apollo]|uniref:(apollo) hypothetical protein n=1 Tax=Parnassius apollo TaxID=110799 RepID=A0A8S3YAV2_PARAO|nr:unnamed protein product [Parnassius apollo]